MSKYELAERCDWCGRQPAQAYPVEKRGVKTKRYAVVVMACGACARRLGLAED